MSPSGRYPRFRAPQGHGEVLCVPGEAELPALLERNRLRPELANVDWWGQSLAEVAREARRDIFTAALKFTSQYADVGESLNADQPLVLTGHQPDLFHPGVWLKNFAAARLAESCGGTAINLIIDSDLCRWPTIRVPTGTPERLQVEMVPFDQADRELPFEERTIADHTLWKSFGERVTRMMTPLISEPLIEQWWPSVLNVSRLNSNLGQSITQARHLLERQWGSNILDLPQSIVCRSRAFRLFAIELFLRAAEFQSAYNQALANYRSVHHLKNHAQPVPDLGETDGWLETPFWLWDARDPRRRSVYVKRAGNELELSDRYGYKGRLSTDATQAVEQLSELESQGIKLRTRALATTLFARLLLADVFIHGIGGAKYDQVTDEICELFLGMPLPDYVTISGTLLLPIAEPVKPSTSLTDLRQELREHRFHPEKHRKQMAISPGESHQVEELAASKQTWINTVKTHDNAAIRHQAIAEANHKLQSFLDDRRGIIEVEMAAAKIADSTAQLRGSREYAYCLFPQALLRNFFRV